MVSQFIGLRSSSESSPFFLLFCLVRDPGRFARNLFHARRVLSYMRMCLPTDFRILFYRLLVKDFVVEVFDLMSISPRDGFARTESVRSIFQGFVSNPRRTLF